MTTQAQTQFMSVTVKDNKEETQQKTYMNQKLYAKTNNKYL